MTTKARFSLSPRHIATALATNFNMIIDQSNPEWLTQQKNKQTQQIKQTMQLKLQENVTMNIGWKKPFTQRTEQEEWKNQTVGCLRGEGWRVIGRWRMGWVPSPQQTNKHNKSNKQRRRTIFSYSSMSQRRRVMGRWRMGWVPSPLNTILPLFQSVHNTAHNTVHNTVHNNTAHNTAHNNTVHNTAHNNTVHNTVCPQHCTQQHVNKTLHTIQFPCSHYSKNTGQELCILHTEHINITIQYLLHRNWTQAGLHYTHKLPSCPEDSQKVSHV